MRFHVPNSELDEYNEEKKEETNATGEQNIAQ